MSKIKSYKECPRMVLKKYFKQREDVLMAFVFGSHAKKRAGRTSDWDIAVYFKPESPGVEWEASRDYPQEREILGYLIETLKTDNVDLIVLNRAPANLCASAIKGLPLVIKDRRIFLEFMLAVSRQAQDYQQTASEFAQIYWRSHSLIREDRDILNKRLIFLESELNDINEFQKLTLLEYQKDSMKRRQVERWIENLMNAAIDISKTLLASEKKTIPDTYRQVLENLEILGVFPEGTGKELAYWVELRNILAHEYLDIRWKRIEDFIKRSEPYFRNLIEAVKDKFLR